MQQRQDMLGVRPEVWAGAFVSILLVCLALQTSDRKTESMAKSEAPKLVSMPNFPVSRGASAAAGTTTTLSKNVSDHAFATLLQQLSDPDAKVRLATLEKLDNSELSNSEQVSLLTGCLLDSDARIRADAALRLGSFRATAIEAIPALKQLAESEPDDLVRARVKDALYNIRMYDYSPFMRDL